MKDFVYSECPGLTESFPTFPTFEWFFLGVDIPETNKSKIKLEMIIDYCGSLYICIGYSLRQKQFQMCQFKLPFLITGST